MSSALGKLSFIKSGFLFGHFPEGAGGGGVQPNFRSSEALLFYRSKEVQKLSKKVESHSKSVEKQVKALKLVNERLIKKAIFF